MSVFVGTMIFDYDIFTYVYAHIYANIGSILCEYDAFELQNMLKHA